MNRLCCIILVVFFLFISGCRNDKKSAQKFNDKNNIVACKLEKKSEKLLSDLIDTIFYVPIMENEGHFFSDINKIIIKDDYIYVHDKYIANVLLVFDKSGNFVRKISRQGRGPGEYIRIWDFDVDSGGIYLHDGNLKKLLVFDAKTGEFVHQIQTKFATNGIKVLNNGDYLFSILKQGDYINKIYRTDKDINILEKIFLYPENYIDDKGDKYIFREIDNTIFFNKPVNDTVYTFNMNGEITGTYYFDFGNNKVPEDLKNSYEKLVEKRNSSNFIYFNETPFVVNDILVSSIYNGNKSATLLYDLTASEYQIMNWDENTSYKDLFYLLFANEDYIVNYIDERRYEKLKTKPDFSNEMLKHLEEGGRILCFYQLKK